MDVQNVRSTKCISYTRLKKLKKLKFLKLKNSDQTFSAVCHDDDDDDGKQPKTFGLNCLILQFLTFLALCSRYIIIKIF